MRNVSDESCKETRHIFYVQFFAENRAVFAVMWKNIFRARHATNYNTKRHMRFEFWITKATDTHSEYIILIALLRQQWFRESASM